MQTIPLCPITGVPARRRIQPISARLISRLWRAAFGVATERQLTAIERFALWDSPCGLAFFEPMLAGDETFYLDLYRRLESRSSLRAPSIVRIEFERMAKLVQPGARVLDVGCGQAGLARHLPHATYIGLDPHRGPTAAITNETVGQHAISHAEEYDAVCALHTIEHVADPLGFARDMVKCVKPGGRLVIVVPSRASPITEIPNFVLNAPPNHLSWWSADALQTLAGRLSLSVEAIEAVPFSSSFDGLIYWMARVAPKLTGKRYFRAHWTWYGALAWSWLAGRVCDKLFRVPATAKPSGLLLVARKPS